MMYVKGNVIAKLPAFLKEKFGEYGLSQWKSSLSGQAADIYDHKIDGAEWYPLRLALVEPVDKACEHLYNNSLRGAIEFGRYVADQEKQQIRFNPLRSTPAAKISKACDRLKSLFDPAEIMPDEVKESDAVIRVTRFPEIDEVIEVIVAGWLQQTFWNNIGTTISIEIIDIPAGQEDLVRYQVKWDAERMPSMSLTNFTGASPMIQEKTLSLPMPSGLNHSVGNSMNLGDSIIKALAEDIGPAAQPLFLWICKNMGKEPSAISAEDIEMLAQQAYASTERSLGASSAQALQKRLIALKI